MSQSGNPRPIDEAMQDKRMEKELVRGLWVSRAKAYCESFPIDREPLYLTLPGSDGFDIEQIIAKELVKVTETGAIHQSNQHRIVAVERNSQAVLQLQKKFPGLVILNQDLNSVLRGPSLLNFPDNAHRKHCRARIVNLDFQENLKVAEDESGEAFEPIFRLISKLVTIHSEGPRIHWTLCVTLNATPAHDDRAEGSRIAFLRDNFKRSSQFAEESKKLLGANLFGRILDEDTTSFGEISVEEFRKVLMIYVPKKTAFIAHSSGWLVDTKNNLSYGCAPQNAPMVTWMMDFTAEPGYSGAPNEVYLGSLSLVLANVGHISPSGEVNPPNA